MAAASCSSRRATTHEFSILRIPELQNPCCTHNSGIPAAGLRQFPIERFLNLRKERGKTPVLIKPSLPWSRAKDWASVWEKPIPRLAGGAPNADSLLMRGAGEEHAPLPGWEGGNSLSHLTRSDELLHHQQTNKDHRVHAHSPSVFRCLFSKAATEVVFHTWDNKISK